MNSDPTSLVIPVPDNLWPKYEEKRAKVILRGEGASLLPPDIFLEALKSNGVIKNDNIDSVKTLIPGTKNKRVICGDLNLKHRQTFAIKYKEETIHFLIIDPLTKSSEVILLHMPIETTPAVITHIFSVLDAKCTVTDIRCEPGRERRHDRWQLMLQCDDKDKIPHHFVLPNRGIEGEDLNIKVFIEGRKYKENKLLPPTSAPSTAQTSAAAHHAPPPPTRLPPPPVPPPSPPRRRPPPPLIKLQMTQTIALHHSRALTR